MQQNKKRIGFFIACVSAMQLHAVSFYSARSQSVNAAREMVGWEEEINRCDWGTTYGSFNITPEYTHTFRSNRIANCLFGADLQCNNGCDPFLKIQGSLVNPIDRDPKAWLADYFGLPMDFDGTVSFKPSISNFLADFSFYLGLDELVSGMFFRVHAPIVHTRWNLNVCEKSTKGTLFHPDGYFAGNHIQSGALLGKALDFFSGTHVMQHLSTVTSAEDSYMVQPVGIFYPLTCSKWACDCSSEFTQTRLSDIEFALGWNFWCNQDYLIGLAVRASVPTGNKPDSCYLFEPIVGSGGHWKLGGALDAHAIFWRNEEETCSVGFYLDANIQHLFETCQRRCFDLCTSGTYSAGQSSRYMLAQHIEQIVSNEVFAEPDIIGFGNEFAPVANLTTFNVAVNIAVEADIAAKFAYTNGNFAIDLGYNFYGRSCEKICPQKSCLTNPLDGKTWALKGDSQVLGVSREPFHHVPLAATQSAATIHSGVNHFISAEMIRSNTVNIDNPILLPDVLDNDFGDRQPTRTSSPPVYLKQSDVDFSGTQAITHKLFTHVNYAWHQYAHCTPYLGAGGEVEFAGCGSCSEGESVCKGCATCFRCAPSQWGVWVKGGVSFN